MDEFEAQPATKTRKVTAKPRVARASSRSRSAAKKSEPKAKPAAAPAPKPKVAAAKPKVEDVQMEDAAPSVASFSQNRWIATGFRKGGQPLSRPVFVVTHAPYKKDAMKNVQSFASERGYDNQGFSVYLSPKSLRAATVTNGGEKMVTMKQNLENEPMDQQHLFYSVGHDVGNSFLRRHGGAARVWTMAKDKESARASVRHFVSNKLGGDPDVDFVLYRVDPAENRTNLMLGVSDNDSL